MLTNDRPLEDIPRLEAALERLDGTAFLGSPCQALVILLRDPDVAQLVSPRDAHELIEAMRRTASTELTVLREARAADDGPVPLPFCVRETKRPTSQQETTMTDTFEAVATEIREKSRIIERIEALDEIIERCTTLDIDDDPVGVLTDAINDDDMNELLQAAPPSTVLVEGIITKIRVEAQREMTELRERLGLPPKSMAFPAAASNDDGDTASA